MVLDDTQHHSIHTTLFPKNTHTSVQSDFAVCLIDRKFGASNTKHIQSESYGMLKPVEIIIWAQQSVKCRGRGRGRRRAEVYQFIVCQLIICQRYVHFFLILIRAKPLIISYMHEDSLHSSICLYVQHLQKNHNNET